MKHWISLAASLLPLVVAADESKLVLKDAPGRNVVLANCTMCHSVDYVLTNSPFPDRKLWEAEVAKMRNVFKAPISDADARTIVDYLAANYGSEAMKAAAK
jgi:mono/diheme cytochrome c family protein